VISYNDAEDEGGGESSGQRANLIELPDTERLVERPRDRRLPFFGNHMVYWLSLCATCAPKQVPAVALEIKEYHNLSVRLNARGGDESHAGRDHPRVHHFEIINAKEEADPAGKLLSNERHLMLPIAACEQNAGAGADGTNNHPAFRASFIRQRRSVFDELELQDVHKKVDRRLVLTYNHGDELEV
jgi:hypothetical protein